MVFQKFCSYGRVASTRLGEIFRELATPWPPESSNVAEPAKARARESAKQNEFGKTRSWLSRPVGDSHGNIRGVKVRSSHRSER
jgi:hypothetical protein